MAIAFDAKTKTSVTTGSPFSISHTPVGTPRWVVVKISSITSTDNLASGNLQYGGAALTRAGRVADSAGEAGSAEIWTVGSGIPSGAQNLTGSFTGSTEKAICIETYTAASDVVTSVTGSAVDDQANPSIALDSGSDTALRTAIIYSGLASPASLTPNGSMTNVDTHTFGTGSKCCRFDRETSPSSGSTAMSWTSASDDVAAFAVAGIEAGAGNSVSGTISQGTSGTGVDGVNLTLTGTGGSAGTDYSVTTSGGGTFSKAVVSGWSGTITCADSNRTLTPTSISVSNVTAGSSGNDFDCYTTYYLSPSGSNSNPGTSASRLQTQAYVKTLLDDDEEAIYGDGSYTPTSFASGNSGTLGVRTHRSENLHGAILTRNSGATDGVTLSGCDKTRFDGFTVQDCKDGINDANGTDNEFLNILFRRCEGVACQLEGTPGTTGTLVQDCIFKSNNIGFRTGHKLPDTNIGNSFTLRNVTAAYNCGKACIGKWDGSAGSAVGQTPGHRNHILALYVADTSTYFTGAPAGKICQTTDGGSTWSEMSTPAENTITGLWGASATDVWACGTRGVLWHYNGSAWSASTPPSPANHLLDIHGSSTSNVWACGKAGTILKYNGSSWSVVTSGTTADLHAIYVVDANNVVVVGAGGVIRTTSDGGTNWTARTSGVATRLHAIAKNSSYWFVVGSSNVILRSADLATWSARTPGVTGQNFRSVTANDSIVWVGGYSDDAQILVSSTDNGDTSFTDRSSLVVFGTLGWPNNDVNFNRLAIIGSGLLIVGGVYNENSDGVAITQAGGDCTYENVVCYENGDDGFDIYNIGAGNEHKFDQCHSFDNDPTNEDDADGNGFKFGVGQAASGAATIQCNECTSAGNSRRGFDDVSPMVVNLDNCTSVHNGEQGIYECAQVRNCISWANVGIDASLTGGGTYDAIIYSTGTITGGAHLTTGDPLFVSQNTYDFHLTGSSPAINGGTDHGFGDDIGAFQYVAGATSHAYLWLMRGLG